LEYFGQKNAPECGNCDVCRKKNETGLGRYEFNKIKAEILEFLGEFDFSIDEIVKKLTFDEEKTIKVVQFLLDNEFIEYNKQGKLTKYS